jgi:hypothetical protein
MIDTKPATNGHGPTTAVLVGALFLISSPTATSSA